MVEGKFIMKKLRVYIDTSVIGGCFDEEFARWSKGLMKDFRLGHYRPVMSDLTAVEIRNAPKSVRNQYMEILDYDAEILREDERVSSLVQFYRRHKILNDKFENDMIHIALATVYEVDLLVSWNFKHIVHFDKIQKFNMLNERSGYKPIKIYSPREVANYEEGT